MTKKISKKELKKLKEQMGISDICHNRPPVGRPAVFVGVTSKQAKKTRRKERSQGLRLVSGFFIYTAIRHTLCKS